MTATTSRKREQVSAPRRNAFMMDPNDVTVIGLDTKDGEEHPLYDARVKEDLEERLVKNIMVNGVIQAVTLAKLPGGIVAVVAGRRRIMHAREANRRLTAAGNDPVRVPSLFRRGNDTALFGVMVSENEHRKDDGPLAKAEKLARYLALGGDEDAAAVHFGVSKATIGNWAKLLDCSKPVRDAVDQGLLSADAARILADLPRDEQVKKLEELKASAPARGGSARRPPISRRTVEESAGKVTKVSKKQLKNLLAFDEDARFNAGFDDQFWQGVRFAMGDLAAEKIKGMRQLMRQAEAEAGSKKAAPKPKAAGKKTRGPAPKKKGK